MNLKLYSVFNIFELNLKFQLKFSYQIYLV